MKSTLTELISQRKSSADMIKYIWNHPNPVRSGIISDLGLSKSTVINAIDSLIKAGIVVEGPPTTPTKGRAPALLRIAPGQCFSAGISLLEHGQAEISLVDASQELITTEKFQDLPEAGNDILTELKHQLETLISKEQLALDNLIGIGLTLPGILDHKQGIVRKSSIFPPSGSLSITDFFKDALNVPCMLLERSKALALTEKTWGDAQDMSTFLYFDGVGLGMFLEGRIFTGHQHYGGEIGFMKICDTDQMEVDGRNGSYNQVTPFRQMGTRVLRAIELGADTIVTDMLQEGRKVSRELIIEAAKQGDSLCRTQLAEGFRMASEMVVNLVYLFNPEAIFLWPWTADLPDVSLDIVRERVQCCNIINQDISVKILPAKHGSAYLSQGIATLPLSIFFGSEIAQALGLSPVSR